MKKLFLTLCLLSLNSYADGLDLEAEMQNEPLDISGVHTQPRQANPIDRFKERRQKLEKLNELMVKKKIERIRMQNEFKLRDEIKAAFQ